MFFPFAECKIGKLKSRRDQQSIRSPSEIILSNWEIRITVASITDIELHASGEVGHGKVLMAFDENLYDLHNGYKT